MGRKPQYDEAAVIDAAVDVFWRHGYSAASINELTAATGLSRSSLYQRFQDKDGLFREALSSYTGRVLRRMNASKADTARGRLDAVLRQFLPNEVKTKRPPGCLLARCCAEMADLPATGQSVALVGLTQQHAVIEGILRDAVSSGELARDADIAALAWYYLGILQAVLNLPQAGATPVGLRCIVDIAMSNWPTVTEPSAPRSKNAAGGRTRGSR
jgi:TetR/AcrR family transcriptional regulator, copper-responsive repressor